MAGNRKERKSLKRARAAEKRREKRAERQRQEQQAQESSRVRKTPRAKLNRWIKEHAQMPSGLRGFISEEDFSGIWDLLSEEVLIEIDTLFLEGELRDKEAMLYCAYLPEFRDLLFRFDEHLDKIFESYKEQVPSAVRKAFPEKGLVSAEELLRLYDKLGQLANSLGIGKMPAAFRNSLASYVFIYLSSRLTPEIYWQLQDVPYVKKDPHANRKINLIFQDLQIGVQRMGLGLLPGYLEIGSMKTLTEAHAVHRKEARQIFDSCDVESDDVDDLRRNADAKFDVITGLVVDYPIGQFEALIGDTSLQFNDVRKILGEGFAGNLFCQVRVTLDMDMREPLKPYTFYKGKVGTNIHVAAQPDFFDLMIYSDRGEINISTAIPYSRIVGEVDYQKFRNVIFDTLINKLATDEFHEMQKKPSVGTITKEVKERTQEATGSEVETEIRDVHAQVIQEAEVKPFYLSVPYVPAKDQETDTNGHVVEQAKRAQEEIGYVPSVSLRGIKGNRVLRALKSLLGDPLSVHGSHYKFTCRNGSSYPIAIHGDRDVGVGLLVNCLKKFGVSMEEFVGCL